MTRWFLLLVVLALPSILSGIALVAHHRGARARGPWLALPAGPWLEGLIGRTGIRVRLDVQPDGTPDAYWPESGTIGLSARTWGGCRATHWAIAAHELGHASNAVHPVARRVLPAMRFASAWGWRLFAAAALVAALGTLEALPYALVALVVSAVAGGVVAGEEALASVRALAWVEADPRVRGEARAVARAATVGAGSAYALAALGQLAVLACWPAVARLASGIPAIPRVPPDWALWWWLLLLPFLALRTLHGLRQVVRPEPVDGDLALASVVHRESVLELLTGVGVTVLVAGVHRAGSGEVWALCLVVALAAAIGPVAGLLRLVVVLPALGLVGRERRDTAFLPLGRGHGAPPAVMALWSDPPWYVRAGWVGSLGYLPLLVALAARVVE